jgi:TrmH family RNA methyltransferase
MAQIYPFRALRYNPARVKVADVVTQPYDKITPDMQDRYYAASPGNLGSVIRSADAFGCAGLLLTGHCADPYDTLCIRASVGTVFALPVARMESAGQALQWAQSLDPRPLIVGTSAHGEAPLHELTLTGPAVLAVGNETFGLSKAWKEGCDVLARIPIHGAASSLNVASAASICLYEAARQRSAKPV